jgi:hypothetical protein
LAEIPEDQPLIEPGAAWPKQLWAPMIAQHDFATWPLHPARVDNSMSSRATLNMPTDFTTLNRLYLVGHSSVNANIAMTITISFGGDGEAAGIHSQALALVVPMLAGIFTSTDLVLTFGALLANLVAGDHMQILVLNTGAATVRIYGVDARYS